MANEMTSAIGFFPIFVGFSSSDPDPASPPDRIVLVNPLMFLGGGESGERGGTPPASRKSIEALKAAAVGEEGEECTVCLEELEKAKEMPCGHRFHGDCIGKWLGMHGSCPVCRYRMPEEEASEQRKDREEEGRTRRRREVMVTIVFGRETPEETTQVVADDVD